MFSIFNRKRHIIETGLLVDSADIHNHLLPGVDDGIQTAADSMAAFRGLHEMGVSRFFLTPHVMEDLSNTRASLEKRFEEFKPSIPKELTVKLAAEYMGKTAFVLSMAKNMAMNFNTPVAIFSLEMSNVQLVNRLIMNVCELDGEIIKSGHFEEHEWTQLNTKIRELYDIPLYIDDTPSLSVFELRTKARRLVREHNVQCIIIDYLQLMNASGMYGFDDLVAQTRSVGDEDLELRFALFLVFVEQFLV